MSQEQTLQMRLADERDLDDLSGLYQAAIDEMNQHQIFQWDEWYPNRAVLAEDIQKKQLHVVLLEKQLAAAYVVNQECDGQYANGQWRFPDSAYAVIHRLCVHPRFQKQGIATKVMKQIEDIQRGNGIEVIRLDAFTKNPYALKLYRKLNYHEVGLANWRKGAFFLMEKKL